MLVTALRNRLVNGPGSLGERARNERWSLLRRTFPDLERYRVLDLGGTTEFWRRAPVRPASVEVVNIAVDDDDDAQEAVSVVRGDACALPSALDGKRYDLVVSNSVIEHIGGHARRIEFARTVAERADRHWIQTPYRFFPIEPHYLFPAAQFAPTPARTWVARRWPLGHAPGGDRDAALGDVLSIELLDISQMRFYFPQSTIVSERLLGVPKSLIAVRN